MSATKPALLGGVSPFRHPPISQCRPRHSRLRPASFGTSGLRSAAGLTAPEESITAIRQRSETSWRVDQQRSTVTNNRTMSRRLARGGTASEDDQLHLRSVLISWLTIAATTPSSDAFVQQAPHVADERAVLVVFEKKRQRPPLTPGQPTRKSLIVTACSSISRSPWLHRRCVVPLNTASHPKFRHRWDDKFFLWSVSAVLRSQYPDNLHWLTASSIPIFNISKRDLSQL